MKELYFLEFVEDFYKYKNIFVNLDFKVIVALSPEISYVLEKYGIPHITPEEYVDQYEIYKIAMYNFEETEEFVNYIDEKICCLLSDFKKYGIKPFDMFFKSFKIHIDNIKIKIHEIDQIIKKENPQKIYFFYSDRKQLDLELLFNDTESIYAQLLILYCSKYNIKFEKKKSLNNKDYYNKINYQSMLRQYLHIHYPNLINVIKAVVRRDCSFLKRIIKPNSDEKTISVLWYGGYNLDPIMNDLMTENIYPEQINIWKYIRQLFKNGNCKTSGNNKLSELVINDNHLTDILCYKNIYFMELLKDPINWIIMKFPVIVQIYEDIMRNIIKNKIQACIASSYGVFPLQIISLICSQMGIPRIAWMHGGYGIWKTNSMYEYIDIRYTDHYFVYGEKIKEFISNLPQKYNCEIYTVGSTVIDRIPTNKQYLETERKMVIYVLIHYHLNHRYYSFYDSNFTDNNYWRLSKKVIDILGDFQDKYDIILKLFPVRNKEKLYQEYLKDKNFNRLKIITGEKSFTELIPYADLFIFDFISTPFFEVAGTDRNIFIYSETEITEYAKESIKKRAYLYNDFYQFEADLRQFLNQGDFSLKKDNYDFVRDYLNNFGYKKSKELSIKNIKNILYKKV